MQERKGTCLRQTSTSRESQSMSRTRDQRGRALFTPSILIAPLAAHCRATPGQPALRCRLSVSLRANEFPHVGHSLFIDLRWHSAMCFAMLSNNISSLRQSPPHSQRSIEPRACEWYARKWRRMPAWDMSSSSTTQSFHRHLVPGVIGSFGYGGSILGDKPKLSVYSNLGSVGEIGGDVYCADIVTALVKSTGGLEE